MTIASVEDLFEHDLKDVYDAEKRLTKALPKMAKAAGSDELRSCIEEHLEVTQTHVKRLEKIFQTLGKKPVGKTCLGMKGLLEEGDETMQAEAKEPFADVALISAARRVEHYEVAAYSSLQSLAEQMEEPEIVSLLEETLREEHEADEKLAEIASQLLGDAGSDPAAEADAGEEGEEEAVAQPVRRSAKKA